MAVANKPDLNAAYRIIREELGRGLVDTGRFVVKVATDAIKAQVDLDGSPQRLNAPGWAAFKKQQRGHTVPLRFDDVLSNPTRYRINGAPAMSQHNPPQNLQVTVELPANRVDVVRKLLTEFTPIYRVPWGVNAKIRDWMVQRLLISVKLAKARI